MQGDYNALMAAAVDYLVAPDTNRRNDSSATWTTSTGDIGVFSDSEEIDDRAAFVDEYNRLAKKVCRLNVTDLHALLTQRSIGSVCW